MARTIDTTAYLNMVRELLVEGHTSVPVPVAGTSMSPFLRHGDTVYLDVPAAPLKKGDIVLYTRPGGQYILHRIVRVNPDGSFIMMGDAQQEPERIESAASIHGRVTSALHKGKRITPQSIRWKLYASVWIWLIPFRRKLMRFVAHIKRKSAED